jgi:pimeloyl-ACP methyl ester carboxylesterase
MIGKLLAIIIGAFSLVLLGGITYRKVRQTRIARMLKITSPNGISEERFVRIGGVDQWIQIRGEDRNNPILLVLHGGPGWPNATFTQPLRPWEEHFTIIQWDHRGTGKTLSRNGKASLSEMTFDQRVSDAIELTEFLCQYLGQDKVVLLAESMGTMTGLPLVQRRPDLFSAFVATDLYVNTVHNETIKYQMTMERLRALGDKKGLATLEAIGADPTRWDLQAWNVNMALAFKTNIPTPNLDRKLLFPLVLTSPIYTLKEIATLLKGFQSSTAMMLPEILAFNAWDLGTTFNVPFYLFQGEEDVITVTGLAKEYFDKIEAPEKNMALIRDAGHFAAFSQPDRFLAELLEHVRPVAISTIPKELVGES